MRSRLFSRRGTFRGGPVVEGNDVQRVYVHRKAFLVHHDDSLDAGRRRRATQVHWKALQEAEPKPITCVEAAEVLRRAHRLLNPEDREQIASGIEAARRRMNNEHLR